MPRLVATCGADGFTYVDDIGFGDGEALDLEGLDLQALQDLALDEDDEEPEPDDATT